MARPEVIRPHIDGWMHVEEIQEFFGMSKAGAQHILERGKVQAQIFDGVKYALEHDIRRYNSELKNTRPNERKPVIIPPTPRGKLTVLEFGKLFGLSRRTVLTHIENGMIHAENLEYGTRRLLIDCSEVERFQNTRRGPGAPKGTVSPLRGVIRELKPPEECFWKRVDIRGEDECWEWKGGRIKHGYGRFSYRGEASLAHRAAYIFTNGPIGDESLYVCHHCDNPPCCNPKHLFLGTAKDNSDDCVSKGRRRTKPAIGTDHYRHKLTEQDVVRIRELGASGVPQRTIAKQFGINQHGVFSIIHRKSWKHIP